MLKKNIYIERNKNIQKKIITFIYLKKLNNKKKKKKGIEMLKYLKK